MILKIDKSFNILAELQISATNEHDLMQISVAII